ncbi:MAG: ATP-binding protein [Chloroflexota bacterium]
MITRIKGKGFKGAEFSDPVGRLTLFIGPNGAGKTARSQALALAIQGWITGQSKTHQAIYQMGAVDGNDRFAVEVETSHKVAFYRRWIRKPDGTVSVDFLVNGRKATAQAFAAEMARCGGYAVADVSTFMALSDRKKIDEIFKLYPPADDFEEIDRRLEAKREEMNKAAQRLRSLESWLERLIDNKKKLPEPSRSLENCKAIRNELIAQEAAMQRTHGQIANGSENSAPNPSKEPAEQANLRETVRRAFQAIADAMQRAGCSSCAAALVLKREAKRIQEVIS